MKKGTVRTHLIFLANTESERKREESERDCKLYCPLLCCLSCHWPRALFVCPSISAQFSFDWSLSLPKGDYPQRSNSKFRHYHLTAVSFNRMDAYSDGKHRFFFSIFFSIRFTSLATWLHRLMVSIFLYPWKQGSAFLKPPFVVWKQSKQRNSIYEFCTGLVHSLFSLNP